MAYVLGIRFSDQNLHCQWHFLPKDLLQHDLLRSLWVLHSQPPLFNFFLGVGLKTFSNPHLFFHLSFLFISFSLLCVLFRSLLEIGVPRRESHLLICLFGLNPSLFLYENYLFYPLWEAFFLAGALLGFLLYTKTRNQGPLFAACAFVTALLFTRASFHPIWFFTLSLGFIFLFRISKRDWLLLGFPSIASVFWMLKNWLLVGSFGMSSALGMGALKMSLTNLPAADLRILVRDGKVSPIVYAPSFAPVIRYKPWLIETISTGIPALDSEGNASCPNPNNRAYVAVSKQMQRAARTLILEKPAAYFATLGDAAQIFLSSAASYEIPNIHLESLEKMEKLYTDILYPGGKRWPVVFLFLAVVVVGFVLSWGKPERIPLFFTSATIFYLTLVTLCLEIGENQRVRFGISPLLFWAFFAVGKGIWEEWKIRKNTLGHPHNF